MISENDSFFHARVPLKLMWQYGMEGGNGGGAH